MDRMSEGRQDIALITGANRGIGFEVCRQLAERNFVVLLTARDAAKARTATRRLGHIGTIEPLALDVADASSIEKAAAEGASRYGYLDVIDAIRTANSGVT
jgi:NADP-dependent 3-hydroxy acid dehydrogenase YdfG